MFVMNQAAKHIHCSY